MRTLVTASEFFNRPCREVFARDCRLVEVTGPMLEEAANQVHAGFC